MRWTLLTATALFATVLVARADASLPKAPVWNAEAAQHYLSDRLTWWRQWKNSERDHETRCISCHTTLPATLALPALRAQTGHVERNVAEMAVVDDVVKRVWTWRDIDPFYPDQTRGIGKSSESRGVESVLNALVLSTRDAERGHLGPDTLQAFSNMWALQIKAGDQKGGFIWLNFHLEPWESPTATYWGATLAALAVARAPDGYAQRSDVAPQIEALQAYLRTGVTGQSLYTRTLLLWADSQLHGVLTPEEKQAVIADLTAAQGPDGGWSTPHLSTWQRVDKTPLPEESDGYATAVIALVLREAGLPAHAAPLKPARVWLIAHQDKITGAIPAQSINKDRKPGTDAYPFMSDEATGMAALALRPGA